MPNPVIYLLAALDLGLYFVDHLVSTHAATLYSRQGTKPWPMVGQLPIWGFPKMGHPKVVP